MTAKNKRARLFRKQGGLCFYCHVPMILLESHPPNGKLPINAATIEHIFGRLNPKRRKRSPIVAACNKCNRDRNRLDLEQFKDEQVRRLRASDPNQASCQ